MGWRKKIGWRSTCETGCHLQGYGVSTQQPTLCDGQWFERPADSRSLRFMRGVSGSCGLALPSNRQCIVSHNSFQPLLQVDGDLQAVLVDQAAAAMTSASPAVVSLFFSAVLY